MAVNLKLINFLIKNYFFGFINIFVFYKLNI
jgi:hypothetical protein